MTHLAILLDLFLAHSIDRIWPIFLSKSKNLIKHENQQKLEKIGIHKGEITKGIINEPRKKMERNKIK